MAGQRILGEDRQRRLLTSRSARSDTRSPANEQYRCSGLPAPTLRGGDAMKTDAIMELVAGYETYADSAELQLDAT
ncbi:hypothetical protein, partial [Streptomyces kronopolitis]